MSSMVDCLICIIPSFSGEHLQIAILKLLIDTITKEPIVIIVKENTKIFKILLSTI